MLPRSARPYPERNVRALVSLCEIEFPDKLVNRVWMTSIQQVGAAEYLASPGGIEESRHLGDNFLVARSGYTALEVPSSVVPQESNYVINPRHPHFEKLVWSQPKEFVFEPRVLDPSLR